MVRECNEEFLVLLERRNTRAPSSWRSSWSDLNQIDKSPTVPLRRGKILWNFLLSPLEDTSPPSDSFLDFLVLL